MWMWIFNILLLVSMDHKFNGPLSHKQTQKTGLRKIYAHAYMHAYAIHSPKYSLFIWKTSREHDMKFIFCIYPFTSGPESYC